MEMLEKGWEQIMSYVINTDKRTYWEYLISSGVIAFLVYKYQKRRESFLGYLFNKKVWLSQSAGIDYALVVFNAIIKVMFLGVLAIYGLRLAYEVTYHLEVWFGQPIALSKTEVLIYYSITLLLAKDFSFFMIHYASHKIPLLWEFHKIHHSATSLNPFTQYRLHPVELILNNVVGILVLSVVTGVFDFLSDEKVEQFLIYGVGAFLFFFMALGANLRHSHVKLRYPSWLEKWLISPYQHQIHHSNSPEHYDKNMGGKFAFWDRMFGTLIRSEEVEKIEFGLGEEDKDYDTFAKNLIISPVKNLVRMFNPFKKK